jgi:DNA polymerase-3 subunit alpha
LVKTIRKVWAQPRARFWWGAGARGTPPADAEAIFEACAKFADYGFNKSHSAPYALLTYQTAYMKANYPVEFLAASMTLDMGNTDKLAEFRTEAARLGIAVEPPSVNQSGVEFNVAGNTIRYALAALKGVGRAAVESIVAARGQRGFADLADFAQRLNPRAVNKRVLESLAAAGAFDALEGDRARALAAVDVVLATAQRVHGAAESGQAELFGGVAAPEPLKIPDVPGFLPAERLKREFDAIGFFLTGHPLDDYAGVLASMRVACWSAFARAVKAGVTAGKVAAIVVSRAERRTKTGNKMGIIGLSDPSGHFEAIIFAEGLQQFRDLLEPGSLVLLTLTAEVQGEEVRARIQSVEALDRAAAKVQRGLRVFLRDEAPLEALAKRLEHRRDGPRNRLAEAGSDATRSSLREAGFEGPKDGNGGVPSEGASERNGGLRRDARGGLGRRDATSGRQCPTNGEGNGCGQRDSERGGQRDSEGDGEINLVVMLGAGAEVEVRLPGCYKVTPQIAGAIKAVPGIVDVQAV